MNAKLPHDIVGRRDHASSGCSTDDHGLSDEMGIVPFID
jgi:hypothetical protein